MTENDKEKVPPPVGEKQENSTAGRAERLDKKVLALVDELKLQIDVLGEGLLGEDF